MAKMTSRIHSILVPPTFALPRNHLGLFQFLDDSLDRSFRDAHFVSHVSKPNLRVAVKTHQHVGMIG